MAGGGLYGDMQSEDPVEAGIRACAERLARHGAEMPVGEISDTIDMARRLLEERSEPTAARGVEFWMETVCVAASARVLYGEAPLGYEELYRASEAWSALVNSWWHPPP